MFCRKCGNPMPDDSRFCAKCGTPVSGETPVRQDTFSGTTQDFRKKSPVNNVGDNVREQDKLPKPSGNLIRVGEMTVDAVNDPTLPEGMFRGSDGSIYWHYTQDMWKHPTDLLMILQVYVIIWFVFVLIGIVTAIVTEDITAIPELSKDGGIVILALSVLTVIIWFFVVLGHGGKKELDFILTDKKITLRAFKKDEERAKKFADAVEIMEFVTGDFSHDAITEQSVAAAGGWSTELDNSLTSMKIHRRHHSIWLAMGPFQTYFHAYPHQLDFVADFIKARLPNIKDKSRR